MPEMRADMLPDADATSDVVNTPVDATPQVAEPVPAPKKKEEPAAPPEARHEVPAGFVPYQALDEERIKRKELERKLKEAEALRSPAPSEIPDDELSEEGKVLKAEIERLNAKLAVKENADRMAAMVGKYPALADKLDEFDEYRASRPNLTLEEATEVFVVTNKLTEKRAARRGLESPNGGERSGADPGALNAADIDRLMKTDYRKFEKMLKAGLINPDKIK